MYHLRLKYLVFVMFIHTLMRSEAKVSDTNCCKELSSGYSKNDTINALEQTSPSVDDATTLDDLEKQAIAIGVVAPVLVENVVDMYDDTADMDLFWNDFSEWYDDEDLYQSFLNQESSIIAALIEGRSERTLR